MFSNHSEYVLKHILIDQIFSNVIIKLCTQESTNINPSNTIKFMVLNDNAVNSVWEGVNEVCKKIV